MLRTLSLKGFRSHHDSRLITKRVNFFFGKPGSGKSSMLDAIVTMLIGKNRYTDARGVGVKDDITVGKGLAAITGEFSSHKITREISAKASQRLSFQDAPTNIAAAQDRLLTMLGVNEEAILALLNPKNILECDEAEQQRILARLMRPPEIAVPEAVRAIGIEAITSTADIDKRISDIKTITIRGLNNEVKELEEAIRSAPAEMEDVRPLVNELRRVQVLHDEQMKAQARAERYTRDLAAAKTSIDSLKSAKPFEARPLQDILDAADTLEASLKENAKLMEECWALRKTAEDEYGKVRNAAATAGSQADAVLGMGSTCGVVAEFECPLTKRDKGRMAALLEGRTKEHKAKLEEIEKSIAPIKARIAEITAENKSINDQLADLEREKREARANQDREADIASAQATLDTLTAQAAEAISQDEITATNDAIAELAAKINAAESTRQAAAARSIKVAQVDAKRQETEKQAAAVDALTALKAEILKTGGAEFLGVMKSLLDRFKLHDVEFSAAPYSLKVSGVTARRLSSGQKLIFDAALRIAAAKATGLGMFAIDDSNRLDDPDRLLIQRLLGESGCQVFVCRTVDKLPAPEALANLPEECGVYWFESPSITGATTITVAH